MGRWQSLESDQAEGCYNRLHVLLRRFWKCRLVGLELYQIHIYARLVEANDLFVLLNLVLLALGVLEPARIELRDYLPRTIEKPDAALFAGDQEALGEAHLLELKQDGGACGRFEARQEVECLLVLIVGCHLSLLAYGLRHHQSIELLLRWLILLALETWPDFT